MVEIIGVRFRETSKVYYFGANGKKANMGDKVIVETARGLECADVALVNTMVEEEKIIKSGNNHRKH